MDEDAFACLLAGIIHCRTGFLLESQVCYERYICRISEDNLFFHQFFCLNISMTALHLGYYSMSYGIIESFRNTYELTGSNYFSSRWKVHLVFLLLHMGRLDDAISHLDQLLGIPEIAGDNAFGSMLHRALAWYHHKNGRPDTAGRILQSNTERLLNAEIVPLPYTDPAILELLYDIQQQSGLCISGYVLKDEIAKAEQGASMLLRGVACRLRAQQLWKIGQPEKAFASFEESLEVLIRTGCLEAVIRAGAEYSLALHEYGNLYEEHRVRERMETYAASLQSKGLVQPTASRTDSALDGVRRFLALLDLMPTTGHTDEQLSRLVGALQRALGAQRTVLFKPNSDGSLEAAGASNLTPVELDTDEFRRIREYLRSESLRTSAAHPVLLRQKRRSLGLAVFTGESAPWLLYLDNTLCDSDFADMSAKTGELLASVLASELRALARAGTRKNAAPFLAPAPTLSTHPPVFWGQGMAQSLQEAQLAAASECSILITGETGVGKERLARFIHEHSACTGAFVPVQLACLPEQLFESELFGHEKGAFTGAIRAKPGRAELAHQGVLFLDEVGDLPPYFQVKLLRFLQEREFTRVGGTQPIQTHFRLIAATHRDLREEVRQGRFREDLYYRLAVVTLHIPALRERPQDIVPLARSFLHHYTTARMQSRQGEKGAEKSTVLSPGEATVLQRYPWPGNIRELQNMVERASVLRTPLLPARDQSRLIPAIHENHCSQRTGKDVSESENSAADVTALSNLLRGCPSLRTVEDAYIQHILHITRGRIHGPQGALAILGMKKSNFYNWRKNRQGAATAAGNSALAPDTTPFYEGEGQDRHI